MMTRVSWFRRFFASPWLFATGFFLLASTALAAGGGHDAYIDLTTTGVGYISIILFVLAYTLVMLEHNIHLRKSKPVIVAAGVIWALIAYEYAQRGDSHFAEGAVRHNILEFGELFLFLLSAMTYINTMQSEMYLKNCVPGWFLAVFRYG